MREDHIDMKQVISVGAMEELSKLYEQLQLTHEEMKIVYKVLPNIAEFLSSNDKRYFAPKKVIKTTTDEHDWTEYWENKKLNRKMTKTIVKQPIENVIEKQEEIELTEAESGVLKLLLEGFDYNAAAEKLVISKTTLKTHVNNIFTKKYVHSLQELIVSEYRKKYNVKEFDYLDDERMSLIQNVVTKLIINGLSYKDIADKLSISLTTVKTHFNRIFRIKNVHSREELIIKEYKRMGLSLNKKEDKKMIDEKTKRKDEFVSILSLKEKDGLNLLLKNLSNQKIANSLGLSLEGANTLKKSIYKKAKGFIKFGDNIRNRQAELIEWWTGEKQQKKSYYVRKTNRPYKKRSAKERVKLLTEITPEEKLPEDNLQIDKNQNVPIEDNSNWLVYNPCHGLPQKIYKSKDKAIEDGKDVAQKSQQKVYILKIDTVITPRCSFDITDVSQKGVKAEYFNTYNQLSDDEIPF